MKEQRVIIDIYSKGEYPADVLSNFYPNGFIFDGIECRSAEGFLQSLKYRNRAKQRAVCALWGINAKKAGARKRLWRITGKVWWQGKRYDRYGEQFTTLITQAYGELYRQNLGFRNALKAAEGKRLTHSIGKSDKRKTILTEGEFICRLTELIEKDGY